MSERTGDVSGPAQAAGKRHTDQPKSDDHPQRFGRAVQENLADTIQPGDSKDVRDTKIGALFETFFSSSTWGTRNSVVLLLRLAVTCQHITKFVHWKFSYTASKCLSNDT